MCGICDDVGLVDQLDGCPARFVRTVPCPSGCDAARSVAAYLTGAERGWRAVRDRPSTRPHQHGRNGYVSLVALVDPQVWQGRTPAQLMRLLRGAEDGIPDHPARYALARRLVAPVA